MFSVPLGMTRPLGGDLLVSCGLASRTLGSRSLPPDLKHNSESRIIPSARLIDDDPVCFPSGREAGRTRHYQRPFRKAMMRSLGRKRGSLMFLGVVAARARSFNCMSACR